MTMGNKKGYSTTKNSKGVNASIILKNIAWIFVIIMIGIMMFYIIQLIIQMPSLLDNMFNFTFPEG